MICTYERIVFLMIQFEELRLRLLESEKPLAELADALGLNERRD